MMHRGRLWKKAGKLEWLLSHSIQMPVQRRRRLKPGPYATLFDAESLHSLSSNKLNPAQAIPPEMQRPQRRNKGVAIATDMDDGSAKPTLDLPPPSTAGAVALTDAKDGRQDWVGTQIWLAK
jgi:hypothetical protein